MTWPTKDDFVDGDVLTAAQVNNIADNLNLANPTGITDGYVLTADGAGSMGWEAVVSGAVFLGEVNLASVSTASVSGLTTTGYKSLLFSIVGITNASSGAAYGLRFNGSTASSYGSVYQDTTTNYHSASATDIRLNQAGGAGTYIYVAGVIYLTTALAGPQVIWTGRRTTSSVQYHFFGGGMFYGGPTVTAVDWYATAANAAGADQRLKVWGQP